MIETIMGAVVLCAAAAFFIFAYQMSGAGSAAGGYTVSADFSDATGIDTGSDVRIGGIKIGVVEALDLDVERYQANVTLRIEDEVKLPEDSSASIVSSGLLGGKFVSVSPGGAEAMLDSGGRIKFTQSSVSFEELIGKFVFSGGGVDSNADAAPAAPKAGAAKEESANNPFSLGL